MTKYHYTPLNLCISRSELRGITQLKVSMICLYHYMSIVVNDSVKEQMPKSWLTVNSNCFLLTI